MLSEIAMNLMYLVGYLNCDDLGFVNVIRSVVKLHIWSNTARRLIPLTFGFIYLVFSRRIRFYFYATVLLLVSIPVGLMACVRYTSVISTASRFLRQNFKTVIMSCTTKISDGRIDDGDNPGAHPVDAENEEGNGGQHR
jgi:hypothetical protein